MEKDLFIKKCQLLFGNRWQTETSKFLNVNLRTVQRWAAGDFPIAQKYGDKISNLVIKRLEQYKEMLSN